MSKRRKQQRQAAKVPVDQKPVPVIVSVPHYMTRPVFKEPAPYRSNKGYEPNG